MIVVKLFFILSVLYSVLPNSYTHVHIGINEADNYVNSSDNESESDDLVDQVETEILHSLDMDQNSSDFHSNLYTNSEFEQPVSLTLSFNAFGENITVNLSSVRSRLASINTPVFIARGSHNDSSSATFQKADNYTLGKAITFYQDYATNSFILVFRDENLNPFFMGIVDIFFIEYIPNLVRKTKREASLQSIDGLKASDIHIVSRISKKKRETRLATISALESRFKRQAESLNPSVIYPQLLVVTDYDIKFSSTSSDDFYKHLVYILAFFNGVDMFFQELTNPEVRLQISGIVVNADRAAAPYINKNRNATGVIDAIPALEGMGEFYAKNLTQLPPESYNIIVNLIDGYICDDHEAVHCTPLIAGVSSLDKRCSDNQPVVSMAIILEDNLAFSGILAATHELGHVLGAEHDGEEVAKDCSFEDGYIMSKYNSSSPFSLSWSDCTRRTFTEELNSKGFECLRHSPTDTDGMVLPPILPGDIKSLNAQCQAVGYIRACSGFQNCLALTCSKSLYPFPNDCEKVGIPAAQGSHCAFGWRCINGLCLPDIEI